MKKDIWYEKSGDLRLLRTQRIVLLLTPVGTLVLCIVAFTMEIFGLPIKPQDNQVIWLALTYYCMPIPAAVAIIAWIRPYLGGILALASIPFIIGYYITLSYLIGWVIADQRDVMMILVWLGVPEITLLALGGALGIIWKIKQ